MVINDYTSWAPECYAITLPTSQEVCRDHQEVDASLLRTRGIAAGIPSPIFPKVSDFIVVESPPLPYWWYERFGIQVPISGRQDGD